MFSLSAIGVILLYSEERNDLATNKFRNIRRFSSIKKPVFTGFFDWACINNSEINLKLTNIFALDR